MGVSVYSLVIAIFTVPSNDCTKGISSPSILPIIVRKYLRIPSSLSHRMVNYPSTHPTSPIFQVLESSSGFVTSSSETLPHKSSVALETVMLNGSSF